MKKLLSVITLLLALVGSAFAENFIKYETFEDDIGFNTVYIDTDAIEPYNAEEESIEHLLYLQSKHDYVVFDWLVTPEDYDYARLSMEISKKHKVYRTLIFTENYGLEYCVCYDGTVIKYTYNRK